MGRAPALTDLRVAGDLARWAAAGFTVDGDGLPLGIPVPIAFLSSPPPPSPS